MADKHGKFGGVNGVLRERLKAKGRQKQQSDFGAAGRVKGLCPHAAGQA